MFAETAKPRVPPIFRIRLKTIENPLMMNGSIFQYVRTALSAEIVIKTGNPWNAKIYPRPDFSGGFARPPNTKLVACVVDFAIASSTWLNPINRVVIAGILNSITAKKTEEITQEGRLWC